MVLKMARPWPHPVTGIYWFRMAVPAKLRTVVNKREEKFSLRTRDPEEARIRHALKAAEVRRRWSGLNKGSRSLTQKEAVALAGEYYRRMLARHEDNPGPQRRWEREWRDGPLEVRRVPMPWSFHRAQVRAFLTREGLLLDDDSFDRVALAVAKAKTQAEDHLLRNAKGDYSPDPNASRFPEWQDRSKPQVTSIVAAFKAYAKEAGLGARTVKKWGPIIDRLVVHVGRDDLSAVTRALLIDWKDQLLVQGLAPRSVRDGYIAAAKATLQYAVEQDWIVSNPAVGIKVRVKKKSRKREKGFTRAEAEIILKATLAKRSAKMSEEMAAAHRWVPWICAYTGARVNEITPLCPADIQTEDGIPLFRIRAENTKADEYRKVPIYDHLIEQGLLDYMKSSGNRPLFYDPERGRGGTPANAQWQKVGERLASWVRELGIPKGVLPNHGWRHRFSSVAMDVDMDERIQNIIQGHAPANEAREYGDLWPRTARREIQKLPRFKVGAPLLKQLPTTSDKASKTKRARVS